MPGPRGVLGAQAQQGLHGDSPAGAKSPVPLKLAVLLTTRRGGTE